MSKYAPLLLTIKEANRMLESEEITPQEARMLLHDVNKKYQEIKKESPKDSVADLLNKLLNEEPGDLNYLL